MKNFSEKTHSSTEGFAPSLDEKIDLLKKKIISIASAEEKYHLLIEMGKKLPALPEEHKTEQNMVRGCQSKLYLYSYEENEKIFFKASADALISAGLAALLVSVYSGETAETILKRPPDFLETLGIYASLSPNRSNGLSHIHLKMKQEALKFIIKANKKC